MAWLTIIFGYLLGAVPTAYIAGHVLKGVDIRQLGDKNVGAANAFRELGPAVGIGVGLIDAAKGALAVLIAQKAEVSQAAVLFTGGAAVIGHNWPVFLGFRGGQGESTTIGILYALVTAPMLIITIPSLLVLAVTRNVIVASAFFFPLLLLLEWLLGIHGLLIMYTLFLACLVGFTHFLRTRQKVIPPA